MRWLTAPLGFLWAIARQSWVAVDPLLRPRSGSSALLLFLVMVFGLVAIILRLLGIDLIDADRWLDAQSGWIEAVASLAFRGLCGLIFFACVVTVGAASVQRVMHLGGKERRRSGLHAGGRPGNADKTGNIGCFAVGSATVLGYFTWFGMMK